jgi:hypothetical protein
MGAIPARGRHHESFWHIGCLSRLVCATCLVSKTEERKEDGKVKETGKSEQSEVKREVNKKLVLRALTEPEFRRQLETTPKDALRMPRFSQENEVEIRFVLAAVKAIEAQIAGLADQLLCANGGPCGIA